MSRIMPAPSISTVADDYVCVLNADGTPASFGGSGAAAQQVQGTAAHDAAVTGNPVLQGGFASSTVPTAVGAGDVVRAWHTLTGAQAITAALQTTPADGAANANAVGLMDITGSARPMQVLPSKSNGTTWDRDRKPNVSKRIASSAASGNPDFLKASAGDLTKFWGLNGAAITYVQIYNKASAPTIGTDTPILTYPVAALAPFDVSIPNGGLYFATGIAYAFTTDAAGTTGAAAAAVTSCNIIGA